ncbi:ABC transporter permease [Georgenia sp. TF02-10]|uniref:ABC transporter permease n=1 Tax=Georgenia sp. TF02-10 TaxID=2917725 RepID=UPI001FA8154D|nr:ABC transporter permease [Georgenia sp. TF02-10]UNX55565.1 ABC transporter permease [Georgenia sp. TF02-10]
MDALSTVWMVAKREVSTRLMTKANIISMAVMLAVILVGTVVGGYFLNRDSEPDTTAVAVDTTAAELTGPLEAAAAEQDLPLEVSTLSRTEAEERILPADDADPSLDAFVGGDPAAPTLMTAEEPDEELQQVVSTAVQAYVIDTQVSELGGDPAAFRTALAQAVPQLEVLQEDESFFDGPGYLVAVIMVTLLLFTLVSTGSTIAMGVVEEKTSRVVEILLATIRPTQLLAGKIIGIGIYGLIQILLLGGASAAAAAYLGLTDTFELDLGAALVWLVVWFLVGYLLYALLFGGFAALVSRQEDIGSVTTPLMFLMFVPFYVTMFMVTSDPDSTAVRVMSQVPFFAPFMMPVRDAFNAVTTWEMALSLAIALVTIPLLVWVAARVYRRAVLHTGGRMKVTEALKG